MASPTVTTCPSLDDVFLAPSASPSSSDSQKKDPESYSIFRKRFHIPSAWAGNQDFHGLVTHTYLTSNHADTMDDVAKSRKTLKTMGYQDASVAMKHDYLCFMLEDLLRKQGKGFVTERDLRANNSLAEFIGNGKPATPDIMLAHEKKWRVLDIYTGHESVDTIKSKYKQNPAMYSVHIINTKFFRYDLTTQLKGLFSDDDLVYLEENFRVFETEWQYWRSCLKIGVIPRNEHKNITIKDLPAAEDAEAKKKKVEEELLRKFQQAISAAEPVAEDL